MFFKLPMNSCRPIRAKTLKQKTVRIMTSASFFTDWMRAPTIVFRPVGCKGVRNIVRANGNWRSFKWIRQYIDYTSLSLQKSTTMLMLVLNSMKKTQPLVHKGRPGGG